MNKQYSILPEVQEIYNSIVAENSNLSKEEIDQKVEELFNAKSANDTDDTEEPEVEDQIKALEKETTSLSERLGSLESKQEKIIGILDDLSAKMNPKTTPKAEDLSQKKEKKNSVEDESDEAEVDEVENNVSTEKVEETSTTEEADSTEEATEAEEKTTEVEDSTEETKEVEDAAEETTEVENSAEEETEETSEGELEENSNEAEEENTEEDSVETEDVENFAEETNKVVDETEKETETTETIENNNNEETMTEEQITALISRIKNELADEAVKAPEVEEVAKDSTDAKENNNIASDYRVRYNDQVTAAWNAYRLKNADALNRLNEINAYNLELRKNDTASGPITIDGDPGIGGFVLPPEIDRMIHGKRTDYSALLNNLDYQQTTSLQFAYATRVGDINMRPVKMCEGGSTITDDATHVRPDNLKAIEGYNLQQGVAQMEEFAAVTPICNSVTRFAAADILADVAAGYRTDYDRKLAQLFIVRLQQAVNHTDNVVEFDPASATDALIEFVKATTKVSDSVVNGKFLFNAKTKAAILEYLFNSGNGGELSMQAFSNGDIPTIFGYPYIVVPNDLLPTLGEGDTRTFVAQSLDGTAIETVDITSPVFYGDFDEYRGKIHGGLSYDVSADAPYEVYDASGVKEVRSAWQRNELVLRGSFYRGGYLADESVIAGMTPVSS